MTHPDSGVSADEPDRSAEHDRPRNISRCAHGSRSRPFLCRWVETQYFVKRRLAALRLAAKHVDGVAVRRGAGSAPRFDWWPNLPRLTTACADRACSIGGASYHVPSAATIRFIECGAQPANTVTQDASSAIRLIPKVMRQPGRCPSTRRDGESNNPHVPARVEQHQGCNRQRDERGAEEHEHVTEPVRHAGPHRRIDTE